MSEASRNKNDFVDVTFLYNQIDTLKAERDELKEWRSKDQSCIEAKDHQITTLAAKLEKAKVGLNDISNASGVSGVAGCKMLARQTLKEIE